MPTRIHQFHSGSAYGDAVTNSMLLLRRHLVSLGFESNIFVEHLDPALDHELRPYTHLEDELSADDVLIIHHSMGHDRIEWLMSLKCRKWLLYHNITPADFFPDGSPFHKYALLGRRQLVQIQYCIERAFAVSEYNAHELREVGYVDVGVIPVLVDDAKFSDIFRPRCLEVATGRPWTVLFVGRVCQNKGHGDLIEAVKFWKKRYLAQPIQFVCVGSFDAGDPFYQELRASVDEAGMNDAFLFTGKLLDKELLDWYARADCYLSLSRHEGFGVPLIESMLSGLPVVALSRAAVPETMGGAGVLIDSAEPELVCRQLARLLRNRARRKEIIRGQSRRARQFGAPHIRRTLREVLDSAGIDVYEGEDLATDADVANRRIRIEGPCDSSYSLALVNRELAKALSANDADVELFCTEGPGDYQPDPAVVANLDSVTRDLMRVGSPEEMTNVVVRNLYPPRVRDAKGHIQVGYFFWEESHFPAIFSRDFNLSLDILLAPSISVADSWRSSGINVPIRYVGSGADHVMAVVAEPLPIALPVGFRFLHVSSCFPRKGPDVLLRAFGKAFRGRDDVNLVIKTFPNPHNQVPELLARLRREEPGFPPVTLINEELSPGQLRTLYEVCQGYVAPSRGEGFGLPMAEAMLHGLPVIATGWGGHTDFCTGETAYLIDYRMAPSGSHVAAAEGSLWAEPDEAHLVELLQAVEHGGAELVARCDRARALIEAEFSWGRVAERFQAVLQEQPQARDFHLEPLRMAWVSTWNETCGIATYSKYLLETLDKDEVQVVIHGRIGSSVQTDEFEMTALWRDANDLSLLELQQRILRDRSEVVILQFNFGFFNVLALAELVAALEASDVRVVLVMHSTQDVDREDFKASLRNGEGGLALASRILVHSVDDLNRLASMGLGANAAFFPHGAMDLQTNGIVAARERLEISRDVKVVATYGFMLPHKGLAELVDGFAEICAARDDVYLFMVNALYPADVSVQMQRDIQSQVDARGIGSRVRMFTGFLPEAVSIALLEAANVVVFPYQETAESASGAVRFGLAARRPVATTPLRIFADLEGQGLRFSGCSAMEIARDLARWLEDDRVEAVVSGQNEWIRARSWPRLMLRLVDLCRGLLSDSATKAPLHSRNNPYG